MKNIETILTDILGVQIYEDHLENKKTLTELMDLIFWIRDLSRKRGDWKTSDEIRKKLIEIGFMVEDTPEGHKWKFRIPE